MMETLENSGRTEEILKAVRLRYRICNYLIRLGMLSLTGSAVGESISSSMHAAPSTVQFFMMTEVVGGGIFLSAIAVTLAIYRCPICDKYLSKFRPRKEYCPSCGVQVVRDP
jgi:hypothetical protein